MTTRVRHLASAFVAVFLLTTIPEQARAGLVFDNYDAPGFLVPYGAASSPVARISVSTTTTITDIAVLDQQTTVGNIKFVIFDIINSTTSNLVYSSAAKLFGADSGSATFKQSDDFSFTLQQGHSYYVGGVSDIAASWSFDGTANTQNGITSVLANGNVGSFTSPVITGTGSFDSTVRLFANATVVPEPASIIMVGMTSLMGLTYARRRCKPASIV